jgi:hypothetical protein
MAALEDFRMRKIIFAAIATLAVAVGGLAAASAAPLCGDLTTLDTSSSNTPNSTPNSTLGG